MRTNASLPLTMPTSARPSTKRIAQALGIVLLRSLILLVPIFAALLVALLPIGTAVPASIWVALAVAVVLLIVALFWFRWTPRAISAAIAGSLAVVLVAVVASQAFASTPPITDAQGQPLPNSIATLEKVNLNGSEQWITIRGRNAGNPVLLYLGMGGPGGGGFATRGLFEPLEDHFVVVSWDEPGTGKSYNAVPISTLTPERFIADAHALTQLLRARFHQDKIYVYGVSWTSILGVWLVQRYPELFYAYIGNGQMVNTTENDILGYQLALRYLTERGDTAMAETLRRNGPPPYSGDGLVDKYLAYIDVLNDYMGAPRYALVVPIIPVFAPEYGFVDKVNHTRGLVESFSVVYPQLKDLDFTTQATRLDVPMYFLVGRRDVNAMASLVERYYSVLRAPHKELIWLEGGHGLNADNLGQFVDVMVNKVLEQTYPDAKVSSTTP
jgi:pimeloyl-ACP methyl ester carboxylesterase